MMLRCSAFTILTAAFTAFLHPAPASGSGSVELINQQTPWRVHIVGGSHIHRTEDGKLEARGRRSSAEVDPASPDIHRLDVNPGFSRPPAQGWTSAEFDDHHWPIYRQDDLFDYIGDHGFARMAWEWQALTAVQMRTRFGISDPDRAGPLELTIVGRGGAAVYVNGQKVGCSHLPGEELQPWTLAEEYPEQAYVDEHGERLPGLSLGDDPQEQWADRYAQRIRRFTFTVPPEVLREGSNVLAVDLRRAPIPHGRLRQHATWGHVGFQEATLLSQSGGGVIGYDQAAEGTHVWTAQPGQQVAASPSEQSLIRRGWHWTLVWTRGKPVRGVDAANPFELLRPVRMAIPRNGVGSGQAILSNPDGLTDVSAQLAGDLTGPDGAAIPADAVDIRYAQQRDGLHYADVLMDEPPSQARAVPVWLLVEVPAGQQPGWYDTQLNLEANGERFSVPVQVLVTGYELPDPRDFEHPQISLEQCPKSVALHYDVEPWSDEHWALLEPSIELLGKAGNDVVTVPVILSNFHVAGRAGGQPSRSGNELTWRQPLVRWIETGDGLAPDLSLLERFLDLYEKHAGQPRALSLWVWDPASADEMADSYEGNQQHSRDVTPAPAKVEVWDPATSEIERREAPTFLSDDAEAFWKPFFDAVNEMVRKRGWDEDTVMLGLGSDVRPGRRTSERLRQWAPNARWELLSHFSGDPGSLHHDRRRDDDHPRLEALRRGRLIAIGDLEIGIRRHVWVRFGGILSARDLEERLERPVEYLDLSTARWHHQPYSPPQVFRTLAMKWGRLGRVGLDFWMPRDEGPSNTTFFNHINDLVAPGPHGAVPTVRYQMLREGVQDFELRKAIVHGYLDLPEDQRQPYRDALRVSLGAGGWLSQHELAYNFPTYVARLQQAAAELAGVDVDAAWDQPPEP